MLVETGGADVRAAWARLLNRARAQRDPVSFDEHTICDACAERLRAH